MSAVNPHALSFIYQSPDTLKPSPHNPRRRNKKALDKIASSIQAFGFNAPIIIDEDSNIIAGEGRWMAAKALNLNEVPTVIVKHLSEPEKRAYRIADNRIAEDAYWHQDTLTAQMQYLAQLETELNLVLTGFELPEIDLMLQTLTADAQEEQLPQLEAKVVTRKGDLWLLGHHRLFCGDALEPASYATVLDVQLAHIVITDPPYNVAINGNVTGRGKHQEFAMASGEMSSTEFADFLKKVTHNLVGHSRDGSIHYVFMDWRHMREILEASKQTYTELKNVCVWAKDNGGMGSLYRSQHELVFVFKNGTAPHTNNIELGKHGRYRTNVWQYAGQNSFAGRSDDLLDAHPTVKPVTLIMDALLDCSKRDQIVLDPFGGSGTTLIAAEKTSRKACLIELGPRYVDLTIRRWQALTGKLATLAATGQAFDEVAPQLEGGADE